jgi:hypothetical protein
MADRRTPQQYSTDHDLLVTLHEQVRALREEDIPSLRDGLKERIQENSNKVADHETRIRTIEQKMWLWTGASGIIGAIASLLANYFLK